MMRGLRPTSRSSSPTLVSCSVRPHRGVHLQRLPQRLAHRHARVQRGEGILEHDLHVAAQPAKVGPAAGDDVDPLSRAVVDRAPQDHFTRGRFDQPKDAPCGGGLSAARLPHQAQRAPETDIEGQASHRGDLALLPAEPAAAHLKGLDEVTHREGRVTARAVGARWPAAAPLTGLVGSISAMVLSLLDQ